MCKKTCGNCESGCKRTKMMVFSHLNKKHEENLQNLMSKNFYLVKDNAALLAFPKENKYAYAGDMFDMEDKIKEGWTLQYGLKYYHNQLFELLKFIRGMDIKLVLDDWEGIEIDYAKYTDEALWELSRMPTTLHDFRLKGLDLTVGQVILDNHCFNAEVLLNVIKNDDREITYNDYVMMCGNYGLMPEMVPLFKVKVNTKPAVLDYAVHRFTIGSKSYLLEQTMLQRPGVCNDLKACYWEEGTDNLIDLPDTAIPSTTISNRDVITSTMGVLSAHSGDFTSYSYEAILWNNTTDS
ncbi:hypothetical protein SM033_00055 [Vibrio phage vB_VpaM_sm033]|nr:hypothetical protein SM033_00055 [Vibrio phage vB_VpaM_sm033]